MWGQATNVVELDETDVAELVEGLVCGVAVHKELHELHRLGPPQVAHRACVRACVRAFLHREGKWWRCGCAISLKAMTSSARLLLFFFHCCVREC